MTIQCKPNLEKGNIVQNGGKGNWVNEHESDETWFNGLECSWKEMAFQVFG